MSMICGYITSNLNRSTMSFHHSIVAMRACRCQCHVTLFSHCCSACRFNFQIFEVDVFFESVLNSELSFYVVGVLVDVGVMYEVRVETEKRFMHVVTSVCCVVRSLHVDIVSGRISRPKWNVFTICASFQIV